MALARVKTWIAGEVLSASDLNSEFNNILNNPSSLVSGMATDLAVADGGTGASTAADARTNLGIGAKVDVAAHATTMDLFTARENVLTGGAVTVTDIADAPYVGAVSWVKQNAAHTWTDGAVFDVQGGANYTAAAGDWIRIYATTVSTFEVTIFRADVNGGVIQRAYDEYTTNADLTAIIPLDDTIPQSTEGTEILSIAFTPKLATSRLRIRCQFFGSVSLDGRNIIAALFLDSVASAVAASVTTSLTANTFVPVLLEYEAANADTNAHTYYIKVGPQSVDNTLRLNGTSAARIFGGVARATLVIEEII